LAAVRFSWAHARQNHALIRFFPYWLKGIDQGAYQHEHFLRGRPELARGIPRQCIKGQGPRRGRRDEVVTPNHYAMPFLPVQGSAWNATPSLLLPSLLPLRDERVRAVASLTERTFVPTLHDWAALMHRRRVLLEERQELERQELERQLQSRVFASTLETRHADVEQALIVHPEQVRATEQASYRENPLVIPDALHMHCRARAMALLRNLDSRYMI
jgi:hypothetical protein